MPRFVLIICLAAAASAAVAVDGGADNSAWLYWDNGSPSSSHYNAYNQWLGNDFSIATLAGYSYVKTMRLYFVNAWPNTTWEGGRIGIFAYNGGTPGAMVWGPVFVRATAAGWNDFPVGKQLGAATSFIAAWEQFYANPNYDLVAYDTGPSQHHTWVNTSSNWSLASANANLMLRAEVDNEHHSATTPASLGRVRAMFW